MDFENPFTLLAIALAIVGTVTAISLDDIFTNKYQTQLKMAQIQCKAVR